MMLDDNNLVYSEEQHEIALILHSDQRTMNLIKTVADSLDENISVSFDVPSNYDDKKVPILDVKVGMNADGKIEHIFYRKPIANKTTIMKSSAMDQSQKMKTLSQECFRRLHNTSDNVPESVMNNILNEFMMDLKNSGYDED